MRYLRQQDVVPEQKLSELRIAVIGTGAIGRQVALQLASMGAKHMVLIDFDTVEEHNLPVQGFKEAQLGKPKVEAVAEDCHALNSQLNLLPINERYKAKTHASLADVLFSCVDSIEGRRAIFRSNPQKFFVDGRMAAEEMRILCVFDPESASTYLQTLEGPFREAPCTAKSTIYCANVAAGMMIQQFTKWLRGMVLDKDIRFSMIGNSIFL